ncbi:MAG: hypothetical protein V1906_01495 [Candidatus Woesearchaeota archaeon]
MKIAIIVSAMLLLSLTGCAVEQAQDEKCSGLGLSEAKAIALGSECGQKGALKDTKVCNEGTKTWWIDLEPNEKNEICNPACVVNTETKTAEINWRCTGLIPQ